MSRIRIRSAKSVAALAGLFFISASLQAAPLRFLPWDSGTAARPLALRTAKGVTDLKDLHPSRRSDPFDGGSAEAPAVLIAKDRKGADGKELAVPIKMSADFKKPLVILIPDPKDPSGLRTFVVEDSPASFAWGSLRLINATGTPLLIRHDKTVKALAASWTPVDLASGGAARNVGVELAAASAPKTLLYSSVWEHEPDVRQLVIILPGTDTRTGTVDFKIIPEDRRHLAAVPAGSGN